MAKKLCPDCNIPMLLVIFLSNGEPCEPYLKCPGCQIEINPEDPVDPMSIDNYRGGGR